MALGIDLRARAVRAYMEKQGTAHQIAARFYVSLSSLFRWVKRNKEGAALEAKHSTGRRRVVKDPEVLRQLYREQPDLPQWQAATIYQEQTGVRICQKTVSRTLFRLAVTRKKRPSVLWNKAPNA